MILIIHHLIFNKPLDLIHHKSNSNTALCGDNIFILDLYIYLNVIYDIFRAILLLILPIKSEKYINKYNFIPLEPHLLFNVL